MLGIDSVTNHGRPSTEDYMRILSCFPPKTLEKLDLVEDWSGVTKEFVEKIFQEYLAVYAEYKDVRGSSYLKVICLIKKVWIALLNNLKELSGVASHVLAFAKKVRENLESLRDDEDYAAFYVGETMQIFRTRMNDRYPTEFLTPFPATHVFKLCHVKQGTRKDLCKYATYAMEAFIAVWLENKLGDVSHFSGRFLNFDICGYRYFLGTFGWENSTYVSYEIQPDGTYKPLVVHNTWHDVRDVYGGSYKLSLQAGSLKDGSYGAYPRIKGVFIR
jgi:hypothetical protein